MSPSNPSLCHTLFVSMYLFYSLYPFLFSFPPLRCSTQIVLIKNLTIFIILQNGVNFSTDWEVTRQNLTPHYKQLLLTKMAPLIFLCCPFLCLYIPITYFPLNIWDKAWHIPYGDADFCWNRKINERFELL